MAYVYQYPFRSQEIVWISCAPNGQNKATMWPGLVTKVRLFKNRPAIYYMFIDKTEGQYSFSYLDSGKVIKFNEYKLVSTLQTVRTPQQVCLEFLFVWEEHGMEQITVERLQILV